MFLSPPAGWLADDSKLPLPSIVPNHKIIIPKLGSLSMDRFFMLMWICVHFFRSSEHILLSNFLLNPQRHDSQLNCAIELRKQILWLSCYFVPAQDGSTQIPELLRWFHATKELDHMLHRYSFHTNEKKKQYKLVQKGLYLRFTHSFIQPANFYIAFMFYEVMNIISSILTMFFFFYWELQMLLCRGVFEDSQAAAGKEM